MTRVRTRAQLPIGCSQGCRGCAIRFPEVRAARTRVGRTDEPAAAVRLRLARSPRQAFFVTTADRRYGLCALLRAIGPRRLRWFEPASSTSALEIILSFHASCPQASVRDDARNLLHELLEATGLVRGASEAHAWLAHTAAESAPSFARVLMNAVRDPWLCDPSFDDNDKAQMGPSPLLCAAVHSCLRGTDPVEPQAPAWREHVARVVLETVLANDASGSELAQLVARLDGEERPARGVAPFERALGAITDEADPLAGALRFAFALAAPAGSKAARPPSVAAPAAERAVTTWLSTQCEPSELASTPLGRHLCETFIPSIFAVGAVRSLWKIKDETRLAPLADAMLSLPWVILLAHACAPLDDGLAAIGSPAIGELLWRCLAQLLPSSWVSAGRHLRAQAMRFVRSDDERAAAQCFSMLRRLAARVAAHDQTALPGATMLTIFEEAVCADADVAAHFGSSQLVTTEVCALLLIGSSSQGDDGHDSPTAQSSAGNALVSSALRSAADASDNVASLAALVVHRRCGRAHVIVGLRSLLVWHAQSAPESNSSAGARSLLLGVLLRSVREWALLARDMIADRAAMRALLSAWQHESLSPNLAVEIDLTIDALLTMLEAGTRCADSGAPSVMATLPDTPGVIQFCWARLQQSEGSDSANLAQQRVSAQRVAAALVASSELARVEWWRLLASEVIVHTPIRMSRQVLRRVLRCRAAPLDSSSSAALPSGRGWPCVHGALRLRARGACQPSLAILCCPLSSRCVCARARVTEGNREPWRREFDGERPPRRGEHATFPGHHDPAPVGARPSGEAARVERLRRSPSRTDVCRATESRRRAAGAALGGSHGASPLHAVDGCA